MNTKKKQAHTPGEWRVENWGYEGPTANKTKRIIITTTDHAIAEALESYHPDKNDVPGKPSKARRIAKANAALISAAPDLLAACREIHSLVCYGEYPKGMGNGEGAYIRFTDHDKAFKLLSSVLCRIDEK